MNQGRESKSTTVSALQGKAWEAWNASYHETDTEGLRALSEALYCQDMHDRVSALFAELDEQNKQVDALLQAADMFGKQEAAAIG